MSQTYFRELSRGQSPNLIVNGTVEEIMLNYQVNLGYNYHVFPAYLVINGTEFISNSGSGLWGNQSSATEYWHHQGSVIVYCEKTDIPKLSVGQQVEVRGYYCFWMENSRYSDRLHVSQRVNGRYIK